MTDLRASQPSKYTRLQHTAIASAISILTLSYVAYSVMHISTIVTQLGTGLIKTPVTTKDGPRTWGDVLNTKSPAFAAVKCSLASPCSTWFNAAFEGRYNTQMQMLPLMLLAALSVMAWRAVPSKMTKKDPGQGAWAGLNDPSIIDVLNLKSSDRAVREDVKRMDALSPRSFYLGHMIPWTAQDRFLWGRPQLAMLREWARHEHVLVTGSSGSGKTRGTFRQNIAQDAQAGRVAIVYDLKWPQTDSGFRDLALFYHRAGRPVYVFAPFSPTSMRLPLLEGIDDLSEALKLARALIPPPEYKEETGAYFKDTERRAMAAMILAIAQSPTPTMRELQRLGHMNVAEFEAWYRRQLNPQIKEALKAMFDMREESISATLAGVVNKLSIFYNDNVSRATTASDNPAEHIDIKKLCRNGGLLLIGMESKYIQEGEGDILIQLSKRRIDKAIMDVADATKTGDARKDGRVPRTVTYYLDELPGLGRLPYLMSNLAQLRSKSIGMMLGVQNSDQGEVVYSRDYWKAASGNLGTRIDFIQGTSKEEAKALSEEIGNETVYESTSSTSGHRLWGAPWSAEARKTEGTKVAKVPLLSPEEIRRFPRDLAAVFVKGQNPMLVATPSLDSPHIVIRTPSGRRAKIRNELYPMWKKVMGGVQNISSECDALIDSLGVQRPVGAAAEVIKAAPEYWQEWLGALLSEGAMARIQKTDDKLKIMIRKNTLPDKLQQERDINYFIGCGWLGVSQSEDEYTILQEGLEVAGKLLTASLRDFLVRGPALYWARTHKNEVRGYPGSTGEGLASYTAETLSVPPEAAIEMYGLVPDLPIIHENGKPYVQIPLSDPKALSDAINRAEQRDGTQDPFREAKKKRGKSEDRAESRPETTRTTPVEADLEDLDALTPQRNASPPPAEEPDDTANSFITAQLPPTPARTVPPAPTAPPAAPNPSPLMPTIEASDEDDDALPEEDMSGHLSAPKESP